MSVFGGPSLVLGGSWTAPGCSWVALGLLFGVLRTVLGCSWRLLAALELLLAGLGELLGSWDAKSVMKEICFEIISSVTLTKRGGQIGWAWLGLAGLGWAWLGLACLAWLAWLAWLGLAWLAWLRAKGGYKRQCAKPWVLLRFRRQMYIKCRF